MINCLINATLGLDSWQQVNTRGLCDWSAAVWAPLIGSSSHADNVSYRRLVREEVNEVERKEGKERKEGGLTEEWKD